MAAADVPSVDQSSNAATSAMIDWEGQGRVAKAALVLRYDNNAQQKTFGVNLRSVRPVIFPAMMAGSGGHMLEGVCGHQLER